MDTVGVIHGRFQMLHKGHMAVSYTHLTLPTIA